jgi:hypothetical protein
MPRKSPSPPSPIRTRPKNKNTHPGVIVQAPPHRSSAEIQQERAAKARAKAAQEAEKQQNIQRTAAFELTDMINEDVADATPHPALFTPKPQPRPKRKKAIPALIAEGSDDPDNSHDTSSSFSPKPSACSEDSATEEEPASEIDSQSPIPAKMLKAKATRKATTKMSHAPPARKKTKAVEDVAQALDEEMELALDEVPPRKPKKMKVKVRDEIDLVAMKIKEDEIQNNGGKTGNMANPTSGQQAGKEQSGRPAPQSLVSQVQQRNLLKRAVAVANIDLSCPEAKRTKRSSQNVMR